MNVGEYDLRPIWDAILDMYEEVRNICDKHHLRFYVAYGTEIGAMRHKGFIPWDDDFDVYMPRPDYNKFIEIAQRELPAHLKWRSIENDENYDLLFGKVIDVRQDRLNQVKRLSGLDLEQGIFIDFFPLDGLPSTKLGIFWWNVCRAILRRSFTQREKSWRFNNFLYKSAALFLPKFASAREGRFFIQKWISRIPYEKSLYVGWLLSTFKYPKFIKMREWFADAKMVEFDKAMVPVPVGVERDLETLYGDYRQLPPEEKRVPTHQALG